MNSINHDINNETLSYKWETDDRNLFKYHFKAKDYIAFRTKNGDYKLGRVISVTNTRIYVESKGKSFFVTPWDEIKRGYKHFLAEREEIKKDRRGYIQDCINYRASTLNKTKPKSLTSSSTVSDYRYEQPASYSSCYEYFQRSKKLGKQQFFSSPSSTYKKPLNNKQEMVIEPYDIRIITEEEYQLLSEQRAYHKYLNQCLKKERMEKQIEKEKKNNPGSFTISEQRIKRYNNKYIKPEDFKLLEEINKKYNLNIISFYDYSKEKEKQKTIKENQQQQQQQQQQQVPEESYQIYQEEQYQSYQEPVYNNQDDSNQFSFYVQQVESVNDDIDYGSIYSSMYNNMDNDQLDYWTNNDDVNQNYYENNDNQNTTPSSSLYDFESSLNDNSTDYTYANNDDSYLGFSHGLDNKKIEYDLNNEENKKDETFRLIERDYNTKSNEDYLIQFEKLLNTFNSGFILHNEFNRRRIELVRDYFNVDTTKYKL